MLKAAIADLADVPESLAKFYTKRTKGALKGRYVLDVEPTDGFELADIGELRKEEARLAGALEKRVLGDAVDRAIIEAGGNVTLLAPIVKDRLRFDRANLSVKVVDAKGREDVNLRGEAASVSDLIADLRKAPAYARAFDDAPDAADKPNADKSSKPEAWGNAKNLTEHMANIKAQREAQGRSAKFDMRHNPWRRETLNLTDQMLVMRADPTKAAQLRAEAER